MVNAKCRNEKLWLHDRGFLTYYYGTTGATAVVVGLEPAKHHMKSKRQKNTLAKGYLLTHYRIQRQIGGGGFSLVYLAIDEKSGELLRELEARWKQPDPRADLEW